VSGFFVKKLARSIDGEALLIQKMLDAQQELDVFAPVKPVAGPGLLGAQGRELRLPVAQDVGLDAQHDAHFADAEKQFIGYLWSIRGCNGFRHYKGHATRW